MPPADIPGHIHISDISALKRDVNPDQRIWSEHYYQYASCLRVIVGANKDSAVFTCGKQVVGFFVQ